MAITKKSEVKSSFGSDLAKAKKKAKGYVGRDTTEELREGMKKLASFAGRKDTFAQDTRAKRLNQAESNKMMKELKARKNAGEMRKGKK